MRPLGLYTMWAERLTSFAFRSHLGCILGWVLVAACLHVAICWVYNIGFELYLPVSNTCNLLLYANYIWVFLWIVNVKTTTRREYWIVHINRCVFKHIVYQRLGLILYVKIYLADMRSCWTKSTDICTLLNNPDETYGLYLAHYWMKERYFIWYMYIQ